MDPQIIRRPNSNAKYIFEQEHVEDVSELVESPISLPYAASHHFLWKLVFARRQLILRPPENRHRRIYAEDIVLAAAVLGAIAVFFFIVAG
jgi:hypothetical protein